MVVETFVEFFSTKMGVKPLLRNPHLNSQKGYIESSSIKIEDEDITFTGYFLIKTVDDRSSRRLVDDSENVHSRDGSGVLRGLS